MEIFRIFNLKKCQNSTKNTKKQQTIFIFNIKIFSSNFQVFAARVYGIFQKKKKVLYLAKYYESAKVEGAVRFTVP